MTPVTNVVFEIDAEWITDQSKVRSELAHIFHDLATRMDSLGKVKTPFPLNHDEEVHKLHDISGNLVGRLIFYKRTQPRE